MSGHASRRDFLKASGALVVSFSAAGIAGELWTGSASTQELGRPGAQLDSWIAIAADGSVTAFTGKCELGQGLYTAQAQLIAEELVVPLGRVTLVQCDTDRTPDQGTTSGAQSHPANFNRSNLALAAATAREALLRLASERLGAPADQLTVKDGVVTVAADPSRAASYGSLVGGRRFSIPLDPTVRRRHPREWTVLGTAGAAPGPPRHGHRTVRVRAQRPASRDAARTGRPASCRGRDAPWASTSARCGTCPGS